jgi:hypothetical protein
VVNLLRNYLVNSYRAGRSFYSAKRGSISPFSPIRVQNGGHFVPESEIRKRYYEGFENLNSCYLFFDSIDLFDTFFYGELPKFILSIEKDKHPFIISIPNYLKELIPPTFYS